MASEIHHSPLYREFLEGTWLVKLRVGREVYTIWISADGTAPKRLRDAFFHATGCLVLGKFHDAFEVLSINKLMGVITGRLIPGTMFCQPDKRIRTKKRILVAQ